MLYSTTINDEVLFGITGAREARNAAMPQTIKDGEVDIPNPDLLQNDSQYLDLIIKSAIESWCKQYPEVAIPVVVTPGVVVNGVPQQVYRTQAKKALALAGLLTTVETLIEGMAGQEGTFARIDWNDSLTFNRDNALINTMGTALGLTTEQLDQLFITAATL